MPAIDEAQLLAAVAADPRIARIAAEVDAASAEVTTAGIRPNPSVAFDREEVFPSGGGLATNYARLALPLEISGRRSLKVDAARWTTKAVASVGNRARFEITIEALRTFRTAAYERARVELLRAERASLVAAVEVVRKRTTAGAASGYDLQRIELELAAYDDLIAAAETQLAGSRLELGMLAGVAEGVDAAGAFELPTEPPALDAMLGDALNQRADYRALGQRIDSARALERSASRAWVPDVTLAAGFMSQDVGSGSRASGYTAGVELSIPLFERGQADRARATAQARAAAAERHVLARKIPATIRVRHQLLARTIARAKTLTRDQLARLELLLRSAETGYREGGGNVVALLDAYATARDARLRDLELRRDARLAELDLWLALGRRP